MDKLITIYHGSEKIIEHPIFGAGKTNNDFGIGFYCTESEELAKEWAVSSLCDGFSNCYTLDTEYLNVLNLNSPEYTVLNWIAVLLEHRLFSIKTPVARRARQYLINNFSVNVNAFDLIVGYRADDSYFSFAQDFVAGTISLKKLSEAMRLGRLGEQIVLKSQKAYDQIRFLDAEPADAKIYYERKAMRDREARREYRKTKGAAEGLRSTCIAEDGSQGSLFAKDVHRWIQETGKDAKCD